MDSVNTNTIIFGGSSSSNNNSVRYLNGRIQVVYGRNWKWDAY